MFSCEFQNNLSSKTGELRKGIKRERGREKVRKKETIIYKFFPVGRSYIIFCVRLLSMECSTGRQITRG